MSMRAKFTTTASVYHRSTDTLSESKTVTPSWGDATSVKGWFQEGPPAWVQELFGMQLTVDASFICEPSADFRPDDDVANGLADKVTVNSRNYIAVGAQVFKAGRRNKAMVVALRRTD